MAEGSAPMRAHAREPSRGGGRHRGAPPHCEGGDRGAAHRADGCTPEGALSTIPIAERATQAHKAHRSWGLVLQRWLQSDGDARRVRPRGRVANCDATRAARHSRGRVTNRDASRTVRHPRGRVAQRARRARPEYRAARGTEKARYACVLRASIPSSFLNKNKHPVKGASARGDGL